jgi:hypothetical protein
MKTPEIPGQAYNSLYGRAAAAAVADTAAAAREAAAAGAAASGPAVSEAAAWEAAEDAAWEAAGAAAAGEAAAAAAAAAAGAGAGAAAAACRGEGAASARRERLAITLTGATRRGSARPKTSFAALPRRCAHPERQARPGGWRGYREAPARELDERVLAAGEYDLHWRPKAAAKVRVLTS